MELVEADSSYFFNGFLFNEYIEVSKLKKDIKEQIHLEFKEDIDLPSLYLEIVQNNSHLKKEVDKIFFENIMYSHLKNIYVNKIATHPSLGVELFKKKMKSLIENVNHRENIPTNFYSEMQEDGFYLMDALHITTLNTKFIAGFDIGENKGIVETLRLLFVEVVLKDGKPTYFTAGIDIDFKNSVSLVMIRNIQGISKSNRINDEKVNQDDNNDKSDIDNTVNKLYHRVLNLIYSQLDIKLEQIDYKDDREKMYVFCKELDDALLNDTREEVTNRAQSEIFKSVKTLDKLLLPSDNRLNSVDKKDLGEKIQSLLLAYYLKYNFTPEELVKKAKALRLIGYPTKIKFMASNSAKSSTQSASSKQPVSASEMFHSLYFNFRESLELEKWSISWFTDYKFTDQCDIDVIQTTIHSTRNNFKIVFLPDRALTKEIIDYVIRNINSYRWY
ncbi:hypothetical protein M3611_20970 [Priestia megaterium]|uniref:hypothetical protein n=1 Tax=Priestia megaterium TaxID=1404 RepID=UPI00203EF8E3|nr:hypothetical protein [Priestia megaterium]MCM3154485.1 hypothetical protein [Priestia megaterium]